MNLAKTKKISNVQNVNIHNNMQYIQVPSKPKNTMARVVLYWNKIFMLITHQTYTAYSSEKLKKNRIFTSNHM